MYFLSSVQTADFEALCSCIRRSLECSPSEPPSAKEPKKTNLQIRFLHPRLGPDSFRQRNR
jgi:hypothetical protein